MAQTHNAIEENPFSLITAARNGETEFLSSLIEFGGEIDATDQDGMTPLMHAVRNGHTACVNLLLQQDIYTVNLQDNKGYTAFMHAVEHNDTARVDFVLNVLAYLNNEQSPGCASLKMAAARGYVDCVQALVKRPGMRLVDLWRALMAAAQAGQVECADLLMSVLDKEDPNGLQRRVELSHADRQGSAKELLSCFLREEKPFVALTKAIVNGDSEYIQKFTYLTRHITCPEMGELLLWAAQHNQLECMRILAESRATIKQYGQAALLMALENHYGQFVDTLQASGASFDGGEYDVSTNESLDTPLTRAAANGDMRTIEDLVRRGAPVNGCDSNHCTPLYYAVTHNKPHCVQQLIGLGADVNRGDCDPFGDNKTPLDCARNADYHECAAHLFSAGAVDREGKPSYHEQ